MPKRKTPACRPTILQRVTTLEYISKQQQELTFIFQQQQTRLIMTAQDLQTAIDGLKAAVAKVQAEITALKGTPALIDQAQLDQATTDVQTATSTLTAL